MVKPAENLSAYDVIKIQLDALKNNDDKDTGIRQTWLFAHPENRKMTPNDRFRIMLYDVHYRILLNHYSHKIDLIMNTENKYVYGVKVLSEKKNNSIIYGMLKRNDKDCKSCWFTSGVSMPTDQCNSIRKDHPF